MVMLTDLQNFSNSREVSLSRVSVIGLNPRLLKNSMPLAYALIRSAADLEACGSTCR